MSRCFASVVMLSTIAFAGDAPDENRPARPAPVAIHWSAGGPGVRQGVEVVGLDGPSLEALSKLQDDPTSVSSRFRVSVLPQGQTASRDATAIVGTYQVVGKVLKFEPRYPFEPGLRYVARIRLSALPTNPSPGAPDVTSEYTWPEPERGDPAVVTRVDPTGNRLPENLLKVYLHFSKPMSRGKAYGHVRILDASGRALKAPFLELGEELWDPSGTRLTLLLDPGRIKRGLRPREEDGPILEAGKTYTLVVDRDWSDADGFPLREAFRRRFQAGPPDEAQPDPKTWKVAAPAAGSTDPLTVTFPEALDRAMLDRAIEVRGPDGRTVAGCLEVSPEGTRWRFRPERAWVAGTSHLVIDAELEDLAGNSIARPFELDVLGPVTRTTETKTVILPFVTGKNP
ncbi:MAG: Ig-like domain-containing protein [Isosphaeraceae bacterium]|nr:Ig-like domain-containing protein [Isosphaeraceae bacterium]